VNDTTPARPPTLKQLEARAGKFRKAREAAQEKHRETLYRLFDAIAAESGASAALCAARQGRPAEPAAPPAPETLTAIDEEDWHVYVFVLPPPVVRPPCAGLIDQGRYIGGDPVGHACHGVAAETVWLGGLAWRLCASCAALARADSPRLTLPSWRAFVGDDGAVGG
jgi:hypothetical protein